MTRFDDALEDALRRARAYDDVLCATVVTGGDVPVVVRRCEHMDDWWVIERAEHEGRYWEERVQYGSALMYSGRISDADIEGTSGEMLALAEAIECGRSAMFNRCAVEWSEEGYLMSSPRNSRRAGLVGHGLALKLAADIRAKVVLQAPAGE